MPTAGHGTLDAYAQQLTAISNPVAAVDPDTEATIRMMVAQIEGLGQVTRGTLAELIHERPDYVPVLGSVVGLSQERLKRQLQAHTGSDAWITRSRQQPRVIIDLLDDEFGLVDRLAQARGRTYSLADVLIARASRGAGAAGAIDAGRQLEDAVEAVINDLGLPFEARTRYEGRAGATGPADFAIPVGGVQCEIAVGVKGFDSTGSKLTAAYDEVRHMADARRPGQYIFAVVDGIGWRGRRGDLGRLVDMVRNREIDGMFSLAEFDDFRDALRDAAVRAGLLDP